MIDEKRILDKSTDQILKTGKQLFEALVLLIFLSAATATDPFLRRKFGERYFTPLRAFISWQAWGVAIAITTYPLTHYPLATHKITISGATQIIVGAAIYWGYLVMAVIHLQKIRRRRFAGEVWHSRSRGESILDTEDIKRHLFIEALIAIGLYFVLPWCAAFFVFSRILGYIADVMALNALYNRFLDIRDAKIEADYMESALRDGWPPDRASGLYRPPLPSGFKGQHRANIARVLATGEFTPESIKAPTSEPESKPRFKWSAIPGKIWESVRWFFVTSRWFLGLTVGSKWFRKWGTRFAVVVVVIGGAWGIYKAGVFVQHTWRTHQQQVAAARAAQLTNQIASAQANTVEPAPTPPMVAPTTATASPSSADPSTPVVPPVQTPATTKTEPIQKPSEQPQTPVAKLPPTTPTLRKNPVQVAPPAQDSGPSAMQKFAIDLNAGYRDLRIFAKGCEQDIAEQAKRIQTMPESRQEKYLVRLENYKTTITAIVQRQASKLNELKPVLGLTGEAATERLPNATAELAQTLQEMKKDCDDAKDGLNRFSAEIYNASVRR